MSKTFNLCNRSPSRLMWCEGKMRTRRPWWALFQFFFLPINTPKSAFCNNFEFLLIPGVNCLKLETGPRFCVKFIWTIPHCTTVAFGLELFHSTLEMLWHCFDILTSLLFAVISIVKLNMCFPFLFYHSAKIGVLNALFWHQQNCLLHSVFLRRCLAPCCTTVLHSLRLLYVLQSYSFTTLLHCYQHYNILKIHMCSKSQFCFDD